MNASGGRGALRRCMRGVAAMVCASWLAVAPAHGQESLLKAEELIRLQTIPLSRPVAFEAQHTPEQLDFMAWLTLRSLDSTSAWNPRNRAWNLYYSNVRESLEQELRQRFPVVAGVVRSLSQNSDTALARYYTDRMSGAELDEALQFFRSEAGKKYAAYERELVRVYYRGRLELERISIDPEYGSAGDTLTQRRQAWLGRKGVSLESTPPGYEFHVNTAQERFPGVKPADVVFALLAGAPPGSEPLRRLDEMLAGRDREAASRLFASAAWTKAKQARDAWVASLAKTRDLVPLMAAEFRGFADVMAKWQKVRAEPNALPRSIAQVDPATVVVPDDYPLLDIQDTATPEFVAKCLPQVSASTIAKIAETSDGRSIRDITRVLSHPNASNIYIARRGLGACVPLTAPGYPVPAMSSFANTIRVVGMDESDAKRWYRAVAQEIAANGSSQSLVIVPNGNAFEVTFAVNVQKPHTLIYSSRFLYAGTYEAERYRTIQRVAEFKSLSTTSARLTNGAVVHEKIVVSTPEDVRRDQEARTRAAAK